MLTKRIPSVFFGGEFCSLKYERYADNDRVCIRLRCENGEPMATATVNVPDADLDKDEILIKDYSENEGILEALTSVGVVLFTGRYVRLSPWAVAHVCNLLIKP